MKTLVIGFGHKARHGKDAACKVLLEHAGDRYDVRQYSFAEALKREVVAMGDQRTLCEMVNLPYDMNPPMDDPFLPAPHGKQRRLLQWWGTEFRRDQDPDYWVKQTEARILAEKPEIAVISDMRFENEFEMVSRHGVTVNMRRGGDFVYDTNMTHISELELDGAPYDYTIVAHNLIELKDKVVDVFRDAAFRERGMVR